VLQLPAPLLDQSREPVAVRLDRCHHTPRHTQ
jgi:hypothetical protein